MLVQNGRTSRVISAVVAMTLTLVPLITLYISRPTKAPAVPMHRIVLIPVLPMTSAAPKVGTREERRPTALKARTPVEPVQNAHEFQQPIVAEMVPRSSDLSAASAAAPEQETSSPLRLDSTVLGSAIKNGKGEVKKMADASGTYVGDKPVSQSERLASGMARSAKRDCLGPNPGGSLLSIFVIAYMAAADKCK